MKPIFTLACASALFAFTACTAETHEQGDATNSAPFLVWPEDGSTVFADMAIYVGDPTDISSANAGIEGTIAVMVGGDGAEAGAPMPEGAMTLPVGSSFGYVTLPVGAQTVHVQRFDPAGKATSDHKAITYTVEATPADLGVAWLEPRNGATVKSPFKVRFGVTGAEMSPAGQNPLDKTVGHHHISVNKGVIVPGFALPMGTGDYLHYGKAQTEAEVTLDPGTYELTMQFADAAHRSYGKKLASETITVTVE